MRLFQDAGYGRSEALGSVLSGLIQDEMIECYIYVVMNLKA